MHIINRIIVALMILACVPPIFISTPALACSCERKPLAPEEPPPEPKPITSIFAGRVIKFAGKPLEESGARDITFQVSKVWKGSVFKTLVVYNETGCCRRGETLTMGHDYIIYASGSDDQLEENNAIKLTATTEELQQLGAGVIPSIDNPRELKKILLFISSIIVITGAVTYLKTKKHDHGSR
jgi:hypothetical protein